ncbi:hypothetical protein HPP92_022815 [Vanilla planifolia]|uniref:Uncharacterized protein n=1 Tax=Vanilla planifolia TaxID=51239 RepID=A0A835UDW4_VANPL|nr:hypothetical protein HPP92_022815 [Vanilla planifolia]
MDKICKKSGEMAEKNLKKRGHGARSLEAGLAAKREKVPVKEFQDDLVDGGEFFKVSGACKPLGVFEFPWQNEKGMLAPELDGFDLLDVFFSSLVDGCSAAIGLPGDRISPPGPSPIVLLDDPSESYQSDGEANGVDYIWSSALRQPLSAVHRLH